MSEGSDHPPELLVSQDIRSCIETAHAIAAIRRADFNIITKTSPGGSA
jgi:hypothetical protein